MNKPGFADFDFTPFWVLIVGAAVILLIIHRISRAGGSHDFVGGVQSALGININSMSDARRQRKQEEAQKRALRQIKIYGICAIISMTILLISAAYLLGGVAHLIEMDGDGIKMAISGLILGGGGFSCFLYLWLKNKERYDLIYGSYIGKNKK